jgi:hypothetical protein
MRKSSLVIILLLWITTVAAQTFDFDMTKSQPAYTDALGYGYDVNGVPVKGAMTPFYFSVKVHTLFCMLILTDSYGIVSQQSELCIFQCAASAAHFFY